MKLDEFAFLNQQLAGMLKAGIPLEGALRRLCAGMRRGKMRRELLALEADLAAGAPLKEALAKRQLPELYTQMLQVGVESGDLPAVLTLLADYYHRTNSLWNRLKAIMTYPVLVLVASFALSVFLVAVYVGLGFNSAGASSETAWLTTIMSGPFSQVQPGAAANLAIGLVGLFCPPITLLAAIFALAAATLLPRLRGYLVWRTPVFREARLARLASCLSLLLRSGCTLKNALGLLARVEAGTPMAAELLAWEQRAAAGESKFENIVSGKTLIPPLFVWLVASDRESWEPGLDRAAEIYHARALYQAEMILNAAMPVSVVLLGALIATQLLSLVQLVMGGVTSGAGIFPIFTMNSLF